MLNKSEMCTLDLPSLFHNYIKPNATSIEFLRGRVKFGKINSEGEFYYPLGKNGKIQSGTKDSTIVIFFFFI